MQHIDEETSFSRKEAMPPLESKIKAGLEDVRGVGLLKAGTQRQESVVDQQELIADTAGEVGQQPARVSCVPLLADPPQVTLEAARTVGDNGRSRGTGWPVDSVGGLGGAHVHRISLDHVDVDTTGDGTDTVGDQAGVLRRLLDVVDLQDAAVRVQVLPHGGGRVGLEEHSVPGPAVAKLSVSFDVIVSRREAAHPEGVAALQGHARRIHSETWRRLDVDVEGAALLHAPVSDLEERRKGIGA